MRFCSKCGFKIEDGFSFCQSCGKPINENKVLKNEKENTLTGLEAKYEMILIYLIPLIGLIASINKTKRYSDFLRLNYNQSAALFIVEFCISIIMGMFTIIIPFIGALYINIIIVLLIYKVVALLNAYEKQFYKIPLINNLAEKIFKQN